MRKSIVAAVALALTSFAQAQSSINLSNYVLKSTHSLDTLSDMGLEASAVTYARDRGTLFFVGDEGLGVVEISRIGATVGSMSFNWADTGSNNNDAEGLTYLGGGVLVVAEERLQNAYKFTYAPGGSIALGTAPFASIGPTIGNVGIEGISYDPRNASFVTVKQDNPVELRIFDDSVLNSLSFSTIAAADAVPKTLFTGATSLFGLNSVSDVQTLSPVDALAGTAAADNLLVLSLDSRKLIEINRLGQELGSFDVSGITAQAIEGVTIDEKGLIYLVAEGDSVSNPSKLFVLTPVPEPEQYLMMLAGLIGLGLRLKAKQRGRLSLPSIMRRVRDAC